MQSFENLIVDGESSNIYKCFLCTLKTLQTIRNSALAFAKTRSDNKAIYNYSPVYTAQTNPGSTSVKTNRIGFCHVNTAVNTGSTLAIYKPPVGRTRVEPGLVWKNVV